MVNQAMGNHPDVCAQTGGYMKERDTTATLQCQCGRTHEVPVRILVKERSELERENEMLQRQLRSLREDIRRLV